MKKTRLPGRGVPSGKNGRIIYAPWEFPLWTLPSGPQAGCCPHQVLPTPQCPSLQCGVGRGSSERKQCWRWRWMEFPDAPPVFGLLTLQHRCVCVHLTPRFTVYFVGLTSGNHYSPFYLYFTQGQLFISQYSLLGDVLATGPVNILWTQTQRASRLEAKKHNKYMIKHMRLKYRGDFIRLFSCAFSVCSYSIKAWMETDNLEKKIAYSAWQRWGR